MHLDREQLLAQVNAKDRSAYRELFTGYYGALVYYCSTFVRRQEVGEDIVQDVFGRLWETKIHFHTYDSLVNYLYTLVRNAALDWLKHQKVERRYADNYQEDAGYEYEVLKEETYRLLFRAVDELPPRCGEVFRLYMQGHDGPRIAEMLDLSIETVRTHRKNAIRMLRDKLGRFFVLAIIFDLL